MTLEELKQQNAEAEAAEQAAQPDETDLDDVQADDEEPEDDTNSAGDDDGEASDKAQADLEWMQSEEQASEKGQKVPVSSLLTIKKRLKGRLNEKEDEIEQLKREVQQLKGKPAAQAQPLQAPVSAPMPKLEDFYDKPDPDAAYAAEVQSWISRGVENQLSQHFQTQQQQQQQQQQRVQIDTALDQHYDRAAQIVSDGLLTAEEYQGADALLRQTVEQVAPGNGDTFVDALLGRMGEGSEKVVVSLARNAQNLQKFRQSLQDDPSGISAAAYLGELRGKFSGAAARVSQAPRPGSKLKGEGAKSGSAAQRQYNAAHKAGNRQKAFDIKRAAKANGVDVKHW